MHFGWQQAQHRPSAAAAVILLAPNAVISIAAAAQVIRQTSHLAPTVTVTAAQVIIVAQMAVRSPWVSGPAFAQYFTTITVPSFTVAVLQMAKMIA